MGSPSGVTNTLSNTQGLSEDVTAKVFELTFCLRVERRNNLGVLL